MSAKYKLQLNQINDGINFKIPMNLDFNSFGRSDIVNRDFVQNEVEKSINPIIDYETTRFIPLSSNGVKVKDINYKPIFINDDGSLPEQTYYSDIGFTNDDIRFSKNRFKQSFLRLSFYDSDIVTNQNLVTFITIFCRLYTGDLNDMGNQLSGLPKAASNIPVRFNLTDPITEVQGFHEGFHLYYFKNELEKFGPAKELYMRAEFNNAATGKTTRFITTSDTLPINELVNKLHTRYLLTRDNTGYFYSADPTYNNSTNIIESETFNGGNLTIKLYEIKVQ